VKIIAANLSPSHPLIGADLTASFGGGLPDPMAGDLNAKHMDWNSRLNTRRGQLLRGYADDNSCLMFGPDTPPTNPYNPSATPDVLDIVMGKDLPFPVFLTTCSALSTDHLPVFIDNGVVHPFSTHRIALISGVLTGPNSRLTWKFNIRYIRNCTTGWQSTRALRISPSPS